MEKEFAVETENKTLDDAMKNADVFLGLSAAGVVKKVWLKRWQKIQLYLHAQTQILK